LITEAILEDFWSSRPKVRVSDSKEPKVVAALENVALIGHLAKLAGNDPVYDAWS